MKKLTLRKISDSGRSALGLDVDLEGTSRHWFSSKGNITQDHSHLVGSEVNLVGSVSVVRLLDGQRNSLGAGQTDHWLAYGEEVGGIWKE